jgi:predicted ATPase/transcriptional regulator with XRE-family HTH domain/Tfp pilus assembly protein PilF
MASTGSHTFGDLIRRHRLAAGLTQKELAERAGVSVRAIRDLEHGVRNMPRKDTVGLLADAFGLTTEERAVFLVAARAAYAIKRSENLAFGGREYGQATIPFQLTPLIGRERDEAAVVHLLTRGGARLLTLTGPAGVGKTRLAIQAVMALDGRFSGGILFVELATIRDPEDVLPAIAQAMNAQKVGVPARDALVAALRDQKTLLALDNFEQVLPAAHVVLDLLQTCPLLSVMVTSRASLNVRAEQLYSVPPLEVPDLEGLPALGDLERYASVALFVQRARAKKPLFALTTPEQGRLVAEICSLLDGLPLAIELAAAHITLLSLSELRERLGGSSLLPVLSGGMQDMPERHESLAAAIAWSYELLETPEKALFRRLAVFVGGWTLDAAEEVCSDVHRVDEILPCLASLVDKSLVHQEGNSSGPTRFRMLELIHEYAWEQVDANGETDVLRQRHATYFAALAERVAQDLWGSGQVVSLAQLEAEHENLRAALRWTRERRDITTGLRLGIALHRFWLLHGPLDEGRKHLEAILTLPWSEKTLADTALRAWALLVVGSLAWRQCDYDRAVPLLEDALALARTSGSVPTAASALHNLANVAAEQGEFARAAALYEESLTLTRPLEDKVRAVITLKNLAELELSQGHFARARGFAEESLEFFRLLGDTVGIAQALTNLGIAARYEGDFAHADALFEQALELHRELNNAWGIAQTLRHRAGVMQAWNEHVKARSLLQESLLFCCTVGSPLSIAECLESLASLDCAAKLPERAVRLYAVAAAIREEISAPYLPVDRKEIEHDIAALRTELGETAFAAAWKAGHECLVEEVLTELECDN